MLIRVCRSKIHNATVTGKNLRYAGSLRIDKNLLQKAKIYPNEIVLVINLENGQRFETYIIEGKKKEVSLLGGVARLAEIGDRLIIMAFGYINESEAKDFKPSVLVLNNKNEIVST